MNFRFQMSFMNPYDIHKTLINEYVLQKPSDLSLLKRDASRDKTDQDILRENHKFLWDDERAPDTWEQQFAKKYYDKLFKEYCIGDLSRYKENKIALRWRTKQEVIIGKGQFICGNKKCSEEDGLRTWEVNFAYKENGEKKNALVKMRLCVDCSVKLNHHTKRREVKRLKRTHFSDNRKEDSGCKNDLSTKPGNSRGETEVIHGSENAQKSPWNNFKSFEKKTREEEMEDYLQDLLL